METADQLPDLTMHSFAPAAAVEPHPAAAVVAVVAAPAADAVVAGAPAGQLVQDSAAGSAPAVIQLAADPATSIPAATATEFAAALRAAVAAWCGWVEDVHSPVRGPGPATAAPAVAAKHLADYLMLLLQCLTAMSRGICVCALQCTKPAASLAVVAAVVPQDAADTPPNALSDYSSS